MKINIIYIFLCYFFISCFQKKEIEISGYAYKGDIITIVSEDKVVFKKNIDEVFSDNNYFLLNEKFQVYQKNENCKLKIVLDSSQIRLLDTIIEISENNHKPFILFSDPLETKFKRVVGVHNAVDYIR